MSKKFIRKSVLENIRTLSAFDYLNNYHPSLLVKMERRITIIENMIHCIFQMESGIGGHKV